MAGSKASSEVRVTQTEFVRPDVPAESFPTRPSWVWAWVAVYILLGVLALTLIGLWIGANGGVEWSNPTEPGLMYNYHPLFMILGFLFIHGMTNLIYRLIPNGSILGLKISHSLLQLTAFILMCLGVYAVSYSKDYGKTPHVPQHFVSVHSWIGLAVLIIMALQWTCGFFGLLLPGCCHGERRAQYKNSHVFTGNLIFLLGSATILMGLDELSKGSVTLNSLALTVVAYAILGAWLLSTDKFKSGQRENVAAESEERAPLTAERVTTYTN
jgi:hypothetical protein